MLDFSQIRSNSRENSWGHYTKCLLLALFSQDFLGGILIGEKLVKSLNYCFSLLALGLGSLGITGNIKLPKEES